MPTPSSFRHPADQRAVSRAMGWTLAFLMAIAMWAMVLALATSGLL
jgi:hypothetical protein